MNRLLTVVMSAFLALVALPEVLAQEDSWPRTLPMDQGTMTIYPLQVDSKSGDTIHFRAALAYRESPDAEPVFGAGWFESRVDIDTASQVVHPTDLKVTQTRFPAGTADLQTELETALASESAAWNLDFTVAEMNAALKQAEAESLAVQKLNTDPPKIVYRDHPALLVLLDGDPVLREIENSEYQAVINTPYPLIYDGKSYYLNAAKDVWYRAGKATGPYQFDAKTPAEIAAMVQPDDEEAADTAATEPVTAANAPEIVVSTEPAELIVTEGPAAFVPLVDDLLVLQNSEDDVFMHVGSQQYYVPLAGRWYHAASLNGPWTYQAADTLPAAFANIPENSDQADSRVYVAGTEEAREAVLDAQVPKTAAVERGQVDIDVEYDGNPDFDEVDGTDMQYARNTGSTVLESNGLYYLVEDGVWYVSAYPNGPWQVADYRPQEVASIMPTSPVYNVKYVYVYDSTPDVVYVGYTPGYLGSYVYRDTIFYGSGWYYRPWISPYTYYPRFSTWGWNVSYNSWSGWSFGFGWSWGPFDSYYYSGGYWHNQHYWANRYYGYWGPRGYRPRYYARNGYHGYGRDHYGHGNRGYGNQGYRDNGRYASGYGRDSRGRGGQGSGYRQRDDNLYRDGRQRARLADASAYARRTPENGGNQDGSNRAGYKTGKNLAGRSRTEPVTASELGNKARKRDEQFAGKTRRGRSQTEPVRLADLSNKAQLRDQQLPGRKTKEMSRTEPVRASDLGNKARLRDQKSPGMKSKEMNRTEPVRASDLGNKARLRDQESSGRKSKEMNRTEPVRASDLGNKARLKDQESPGRKSKAINRTEPARVAELNQTPRVNDRKVTGAKSGSRSRTEPAGPTRSIIGRAEQASPPVVQKSPRRNRTEPVDTQVRQSGKRTAQSSNAPIPLPQYRTRRGNSSPQSAPSTASRNPAPRRSADRAVTARQTPPASNRGNAAPARSAPQRGAPQSRGQRSHSNAEGGTRRGNSRDRG